MSDSQWVCFTCSGGGAVEVVPLSVAENLAKAAERALDGKRHHRLQLEEALAEFRAAYPAKEAT